MNLMASYARESKTAPSDEYEVISEFIEKSLKPMGLQELLESLLHSLKKLPWLHVDGRGAILLLNSRSHLVMVARCGFTDAEDVPCDRASIRRCACDKVAKDPVVVALRCDHNNFRDGPLAGQAAFHFILPLIADGRAIGTLPLFLQHEQHATDSQSRFLRDLSHVISGIASRRLAEAMVELKELEREEARSDLINKLGVAAEYRDQETGMHVMRMKEYAGLIAEALGLPPEDRERLTTTAPMHDVGKIGIPDEILLKPGRLSVQEFEVMKEHARIGAKILSSPDPLMQDAGEIALTHHEKWDGSGYPRGLEGEEIPLFGRICSVADMFDALTSERPYKSAWPADKAISLIKDSSGTNFDPRVVDAFLQALPGILRIRELYRDEVIDPNEVLDLPPVHASEDAWFSWDGSLSIDIDVIDEHHRYLVDLTNDLHTAVSENHGSKAAGRILRVLERYTHVHFHEEERLMRQYGYARLAEHSAQHEVFCSKIADFWEELKVSPLTLGYEATHFLKDWLVHHVMEEDIHLRDLHVLAVLLRMLALVALETNRTQDSQIDTMVDAYNKLTGNHLGREDMARVIRDAEETRQPAAEYLKSVAANLSDEFKATLAEAARLAATPDGTNSGSERNLLAELTKALDMPGLEV